MLWEFYGTIFGWFLRALSIDISLRAVDGMPSYSPSNLMCLIATILLSFVTALNTHPKAPSPILQIYLYS